MNISYVRTSSAESDVAAAVDVLPVDAFDTVASSFLLQEKNVIRIKAISAIIESFFFILSPPVLFYFLLEGRPALFPSRTLQI